MKGFDFQIFLVFISAVFVLAGCGDDDEADDKKDSPAVNSYLTCPDENHPHLIDLNLPLGTKWACCNVGADKPEAYGGYYAWGETEEKTYYSWRNYTHCDGAEYTSHDIGYNIAGTQYDVAYVKWGESWAMPTLEQVKELLNNSTSTRTTMNGVNGYKITGSNGGNIFLPEAGYRENGILVDVGRNGSYWLSIPSSYSNYNYAYCLCFGDRDAYGNLQYPNYYGNPRYIGMSVRPVSR